MMISRRRKKPTWQIKIAKLHIEELFEEAEKLANQGELNLAKRYISIARKIAEKFNIRLEREKKLKFCRKCNTYFVAGKTALYRTNPKTKALEVRCLKCGYVRRYRYK
ncbi:MAG: ribonuclease P [Candidatus Nanohaloarchaeota archaeon]|nr:ribonuclease P [Candidatus Nanohaloarchaeota archaeon]